MTLKEKKRIYMKEYSSRPEVKARQKANWFKNHKINLEKLKKYRNTQKAKNRAKERYKAKKKDNEWLQTRYKVHKKYRNSKSFKTKQKNKYLKSVFGITLSDFKQKCRQQNNKCAICNKKETSTHQSGTVRQLSVDHSHKTGKIRGLLCGKCNIGIGFFDDNTKLLRNVIKYLKKWS